MGGGEKKEGSGGEGKHIVLSTCRCTTAGTCAGVEHMRGNAGGATLDTMGVLGGAEAAVVSDWTGGVFAGGAWEGASRFTSLPT